MRGKRRRLANLRSFAVELNMRLRLAALALLIAAPIGAHGQTPITLDQAMADPDWIGAPVDQAWWAWDSQRVHYSLKRSGSPVHDVYVQGVDGAAASQVSESGLAALDAAQPVYDRERRRALFVRNGDVFLRDLATGALTQITRSGDSEVEPQFAANGSDVQFHVGNDWFRWSPADRLVAPAALPRAEKDPNAAPAPDALRDMQLRLIATLQRQKDNADALHAKFEAERKADATRAAQPVYLGSDLQIDASTLSPNGRWLIVITSGKDGDGGRVGKLPKYVTASGYEEFEDERTRVGRNVPVGQALRLVDLRDGKVRELSLDSLPGVAEDPLADLRAAQKLPALKGNRAVRVQTDGDDSGQAVHWSADGNQVALLLRAVDNKDRWIATVDFVNGKLQSAHRLTDPAWINWNFNDFGWLPDNRTLWFLSEQSGYSQLYTAAPGANPKALTEGAWEASAPVLSADGNTFYFVCNRKWPGDYEICAKDLAGGDVREITALDGVEDFALSPDGKCLLVRYSASYLPIQAAVVPVTGGDAIKLTDTRTAEFKSRSWIAPQFVQVPSTHGAAPIWAKLYRPATLEAGKKYPVVMFVHGAGYLQNVSARYPNYFREQMFHNLLVQQGYLVLDMDYRASEGYGRAWRTAIYRHMGHPELDDYLDGVAWMIAKQQGDPAHVGIYGGSYGGFMTFMALFRAPDVFTAGAALRPVSDWTSYNHEYTSNILNTPDLDPEAYRTSSPIEYAEGLRGHLLIAHGMIDDNVFFQDSVRLAQRLIELKKDHWELAPYPMERHGFVNPESWYDEYRRIDQLFERTLK
jgi:dipeptidyl aminopeptidase/acylaminoacyl peptidase